MCTYSESSLPVVYTCAGCSNLAQLANDIGLWLHQNQHAQMASIAGIAGQVDIHLAVLASGRPVIAIDGCQRDCVKLCLQQHDCQPNWHIRLDKLDIAMRSEGSCSLSETFTAMQYVSAQMGLDPDQHFADHLKSPQSP
ncbi:MAG: putative zinc-binding protein [Idiomarina sp.]|nr:putative zinc-binding protein [Idiomarina sp.]